ncbi:MAG: DinB family protein [Nakamurella sp.]
MTQNPAAPDAPEPDDKDWTWVLDRSCSECGYDSASIARESVAARLLGATPRWQSALARKDATDRPAPQTWSVLEYGCHVRDVHRMFGERARLILTENDPEFANWDQDETALSQEYWKARPAVVAPEIVEAAAAAARNFTGLSDQQWSRTGRRSNGSVFTMETLAFYYLHDVEHHLHDVGA